MEILKLRRLVGDEVRNGRYLVCGEIGLLFWKLKNPKIEKKFLKSK
jgi:hypothetical protein